MTETPGRQRRGRRRWRGWILRTDDHARQQVDEELQAHLDARVAHLVAHGMAPDAARAEALRRFGDFEAGRAALHAQAIARRRRLDLGERIGSVLQDARYVLRTLRRAPVFTAGVVATLTLGLGINSAVFRVADRVLFRAPDGVREPRAVRRVETTLRGGGSSPMRATIFSYPDARLIKESGAFQVAAVYSAPRVTTAADGREMTTAAADADFFPLLGAAVHTGRTFDPSEGAPGSGLAVAVVSFDFWKGRLNAAPLDDRSILTLGGKTYRVVGVMGRGFTGIDLDPVDVWLPIGAVEFGRGTVNGVVIPWYQSDMLRALKIVGRPVSGTADGALTERLTALFAGSDAALGRPARTASMPPIVPVADASRTADTNRLLTRLAAVAAFVLLIACANAVNLLLARGLRRSQEIAIRMAVGASRARLFRLLLVESVALALVGGAAAALAGEWTGGILRRLIFPDARWTSALFDRRTLVFTAALALAAGIAAGIAPALQATSPDLLSALKEGRGRGTSRPQYTRAALVVVQMALSLVLLVSAGLLVVSLLRLNAVALGFDPRGLVTAAVGPAGFEPVQPSAADLASVIGVHGAVKQVAVASIAPFGASAMRDISVPGSSFVPESVRDQPFVMAVSANYFGVMGTRVVEGRAFNNGDTTGSEPVAVVSESMARRYWGPAIPPGACILLIPAPCARVVGIVQDVRDAPAGAHPPMRFYLPLDQQGRSPSAVIVRTSEADASVVGTALRVAVPAGQRATIEITADRVARAVRPWRTATLLFLALGAVALALACVGVYSVMNYMVSERLHELGIRAVLGATRRDILRLVLGHGLRLTALGGCFGLVCAAGTGRVLRTLLFDVSPFHPAVYAVALAFLGAAGLAAMLPPALRASRLNPAGALRSE